MRHFGDLLGLRVALAQGGGLTTKAIDLKGTDGVSFALWYGAIAATGTAFTAKLQHSDAAATGFVDIPAADYGSNPANAVPTPGARVSGVNQHVIKTLSYRGIKRYVRAVLTQTATGTNINAIAIVNPLEKPGA